MARAHRSRFPQSQQQCPQSVPTPRQGQQLSADPGADTHERGHTGRPPRPTKRSDPPHQKHGRRQSEGRRRGAAATVVEQATDRRCRSGPSLGINPWDTYDNLVDGGPSQPGSQCHGPLQIVGPFQRQTHGDLLGGSGFRPRYGRNYLECGVGPLLFRLGGPAADRMPMDARGVLPPPLGCLRWCRFGVFIVVHMWSDWIPAGRTGPVNSYA